MNYGIKKIWVFGDKVRDVGYFLLQQKRFKNDLMLENFELWNRYLSEKDKKRQAWWLHLIQKNEDKIKNQAKVEFSEYREAKIWKR